MPNMDGHTATLNISTYEREQQRPHVPVIALTASVRAEDKEAAKQAGMDGFTSKPINIDALMLEIQRLCIKS